MPSLNEVFFGRGDKNKRLTTKTAEQNAALKRYFEQSIESSPLYGAGSNFLQSLLSNEPGAFAAFEAPYMQQFQQQIAPGIAERFAGMGTGAGAMSSSGLNNSLAQAGGNLQNQLASLRGNMQMQGLGQALQYAQQPYTNLLGGISQNTFENTYQPGNLGLFGEFATSFAKSAGKTLGGGGFGQPGAGAPGA